MVDSVLILYKYQADEIYISIGIYMAGGIIYFSDINSSKNHILFDFYAHVHYYIRN
jgi:hypothetical protein